MPNLFENSLVEKVARLYEKYPYPNYPLLAKPRWQDGYLGSASFIGKLYQDIFGLHPAIKTVDPSRRNILSVGSGEILPYILRKNEPRDHCLYCVDVSKRSLFRAKIRLLLSTKKTKFFVDDINHFLLNKNVPEQFAHIEAYGVLHHLPDPGKTVRMLAKALLPNGTMRVMVYNTPGRRWIIEVQKALLDMKLSLFSKKDLSVARSLLNDLAGLSPVFKRRLKHMGLSTFGNDARFVDTFLHSHEAKLSIKRWFEIFAEAGLEIFSVFDRYGELDDLPNPFWKVPSSDLLQQRAVEGTFLNNLELYVCKKVKSDSQNRKNKANFDSIHYGHLLIKSPPSLWGRYEENEHLSILKKHNVWRALIRHVAGKNHLKIDGMKDECIKRLCRIGAILPEELPLTTREKYIKPLPSKDLGTNKKQKTSAFSKEAQVKFIPLEKRIREILGSKKANNIEKRVTCILERLRRAVE